MKNFVFTSESVCAGHPDKICDRISDSIVDAALAQDPHSRTGIETVAGANQISLFGEIKSKATIDYEAVVRETVKDLGYTVPEWGFSQESTFTNNVHAQSPEIAMGVDQDGAGDQGMMFGYACDETEELMPMPIQIAHALTRRIDEAREKKELTWLRPDGKAQVTVRYENGKPVAIEKLVAAVAHDEEAFAADVREAIIKHIFTPVLKKYGLALPADADITVNGTGLWHIPGPESDAGLTGRKIVVDTYGGYARVGGGAFSGKDPSKVDRSGAYAARYIANEIFNLINEYTNDSHVSKFFLTDEIANACYGLTAGFTSVVYTPTLEPEETIDSMMLSFLYALMTYGFNIYLKERSLRTNSAPYRLPYEKKIVKKAQKDTLSRTARGDLVSTPLADNIIAIIVENIRNQMDLKEFILKNHRMNRSKFWDYVKLSLYWGYNFAETLLEPERVKPVKKMKAAN